MARPGQRARLVTAPTGTATANSSSCLIWGEASYRYTPTLGYVVAGTLKLSHQIFMTPRVCGAG